MLEKYCTHFSRIKTDLLASELAKVKTLYSCAFSKGCKSKEEHDTLWLCLGCCKVGCGQVTKSKCLLQHSLKAGKD